MPLPAEISLVDQPHARFRFSTTQTVSILGKAHRRIYPNATRFLRRLGERTNLLFQQDSVQPNDTTSAAAFVFRVQRPAALEVGEDESYELRITTTQIFLIAPTDFGILRGIETLLQTLSSDSTGYYFPTLTIRDKPRFVWRGLMIDPCRHFMDFHHLKRILDQMALVKLNVLHLHLSEDQGFRVESKVYPRLHEFGSDGQYYTQEQIREIVRYAGELGIRVMPEFDVPGHTGAWLVGHPELASGAGAGPNGTHKIARNFGRGTSNMDPTRDTVYRFLDRFIGEMVTLFPDAYFHIGGDEVVGRIWRESPSIAAFMKEKGFKTTGELQHYFNGRLREILRKHGKIMVGWDEIFEGDLPKDIVIHTWQRKDTLYRTVRAGHRGILSQGYYIDLNHPASQHYLNDPLPNDSLVSAEEAQRILGGEATMWSEFTPHEIVDSRIWPRTAAIAERLWSPRSVRDVDDMYRRLRAISLRLEDVGSSHEKNYEMLLRRILNSSDAGHIQTLRTVVDFIEPLKEYARGRFFYATTMPFSDVVDAARPDAPGVRPFSKAVEAVLLSATAATLSSSSATALPIQATDDAASARVREQLQRWQRNPPAFNALVAQAPKLRPLQRLSDMLASSATIALQALDILQGSTSQLLGRLPPSLERKLSARKLPTKQQQQVRQEFTAFKTSAEQAVAQYYLNARETFRETRKPYGMCEVQIVPHLERLMLLATQATAQSLARYEERVKALTQSATKASSATSGALGR
jgi:hexosaminidase